MADFVGREGTAPSRIVYKTIMLTITSSPNVSIHYNTFCTVIKGIYNDANCGQGWIRTTVGLSHQIYSLALLTTQAPAHYFNYSQDVKEQSISEPLASHLLVPLPF